MTRAPGVRSVAPRYGRVDGTRLVIRDGDGALLARRDGLTVTLTPRAVDAGALTFRLKTAGVRDGPLASRMRRRGHLPPARLRAVTAQPS